MTSLDHNNFYIKYIELNVNQKQNTFKYRKCRMMAKPLAVAGKMMRRAA